MLSYVSRLSRCRNWVCAEIECRGGRGNTPSRRGKMKTKAEELDYHPDKQEREFYWFSPSPKSCYFITVKFFQNNLIWNRGSPLDLLKHADVTKRVKGSSSIKLHWRTTPTYDEDRARSRTVGPRNGFFARTVKTHEVWHAVKPLCVSLPNVWQILF